MNNQNLLIYQLPYLWEIMSELEGYLNFKIIEISNQKKLNDQINLSPNYLILTKKQIPKSLKWKRSSSTCYANLMVIDFVGFQPDIPSDFVIVPVSCHPVSGLFYLFLAVPEQPGVVNGEILDRVVDIGDDVVGVSPFPSRDIRQYFVREQEIE